MHIPVLLNECLQFFRDTKLATFIDANLGLGGHSKAILDQHPELELLIGIDQDPNALTRASQQLQDHKNRIQLICGNFADILPNLSTKADGIFFDLGVSSLQLDTPERGFSFLRDGPLDMRMNPESLLTAEEIVNSYSERDLANVIYEYGEEHASRRIAKAIVEARKKQRFISTLQLADCIASILPRRGKTHPATKTFQALRMAVNDELPTIRQALPAAISLLQPHGRIGVISFHSLEDRIVKETFKQRPDLQILTKKPLTASLEECRANPRSRSAKLRFAEKTLD
jgi:16S rRNA (cytosine1402-N4)-methyltransferase